MECHISIVAILRLASKGDFVFCSIIFLVVKKPSLLVLSLALPFISGFVGSFFTVSSVNSWYTLLEKPSFSPPNWIFGPVWTTLYFLMGIALYLVWAKVSKVKSALYAVKVFLAHLIIYASWSFTFFGLKNPGLALINILLLLGLIVYVINLFKKIDRRTEYLLLPYLAWVSFATILNFFIWQLN